MREILYANREAWLQLRTGRLGASEIAALFAGQQSITDWISKFAEQMRGAAK